MDYKIMKNELYHWGIKGQKWGIRRYQNDDGSLTSEGKKRYKYSDLSEDGKRKIKKAIIDATLFYSANLGAQLATDSIGDKYSSMTIGQAIKNPKTKQGKLAIGLMLANTALAGSQILYLVNAVNKSKKIYEEDAKKQNRG